MRDLHKEAIPCLYFKENNACEKLRLETTGLVNIDISQYLAKSNLWSIINAAF